MNNDVNNVLSTPGCVDSRQPVALHDQGIMLAECFQVQVNYVSYRHINTKTPILEFSYVVICIRRRDRLDAHLDTRFQSYSTVLSLFANVSLNGPGYFAR